MDEETKEYQREYRKKNKERLKVLRRERLKCPEVKAKRDAYNKEYRRNNSCDSKAEAELGMHTRQCPKCDEELVYKTKGGRNTAESNGSACHRCKVASVETRKKMSEARKGRRLSDEHRIQISLSKGGSGDLEDIALMRDRGRDGEMVQLRKDCFKRDNWTCRYCDDKRSTPLNAHHILSWSKHKDNRFFLNNLITLCKSCHKEEHRINRTI